MAVVLALMTALSYGVGDFTGGVASTRASPLTVTASAHSIGLVLLVVTAALVGATHVGAVDLVLGGVGGAFGCLGVVLLYQGLSAGVMAVVSPVSAVIAALVPVVGGLIAGERPGKAALIGIVVALCAIALVSRSGPMGRPSRATLQLAIGSGLGFGLYFLCISGVHESAGLWPLVMGRTVSVILASSIARARGLPIIVPLSALALTVAAGVLDVAANVTFLLATQHGLLSVVGVIASLYPAGTVLLAITVRDERLSVTQGVGLAAAAGALVLIAV